MSESGNCVENPQEEPASRDIYVNPENATLEMLLQDKARMPYIPRKIDIERMRELSFLGSTFRQGKEEGEPVRVLDIGGGHGFVDKLLADEFNRQNINSLVVDLDIEPEILQGAQKAYAGTKGLSFVQSDAESEGPNLFNKSFDLAIASWPENKHMLSGDDRYTDLIHNNKSPFVVWVGDEQVGDITAKFDPKNNYTLIAVWHGRHNFEFLSKFDLHGYLSNPRKGNNLFMVYARNDLGEGIGQAKELLKQNLKGPEYPWEAGINNKFPKDSSEASLT